MGTNASLIIKPKLYVNDRSADLTMLKESRLVVTTQNYIDQIPTTINFDHLSFDNEKETTV